MASVFITYADDRFKISRDRIIRQARLSGQFDKIKGYSPKDLPEYVRSSPLFAFPKGGGYWCWKPYVIRHALQECKEGDIVYYCDAGCSLRNNSSEWETFQRLMQNHSAIFFQYRDGFTYNWGENCDKMSIKYWIKPSTSSYFRQFIEPSFLDYSKIWAGFMIFKKIKQLSIILDEWFKLTLFHPELIMDPYGPDLAQKDAFYHTHDQAVLTPLVYHYHKEDNALVLPETAESRIGDPAVIGTRWMQGKLPGYQFIKYRLWTLLHGDNIFKS